VVAKIEEIAADTDVDGLLFSWPDFVDGCRRFGQNIKPRLRF
jgi:pyrimidine oxygenase